MEFSAKSLKLTWEKSSNGKTGLLIPTKRIITPFTLKKIAMSKMTSISFITGEFSGSSVSFSPLFWVLIDTSSSVEFFGVYAADIVELDLESESIIIDDNEDRTNIPLVCVRKAVWNKSTDMDNFKLAEDKNQYILSELQMNCNASFLDIYQGKSMLNSVIEIINFWKHGVAFEKSTQEKTMCEEIKIDISESCFSLNFSYNPYLINNEVWDKLLDKWCKYFNELPMNNNYVPDENFRVSYQLSVLEQIGIFVA